MNTGTGFQARFAGKRIDSNLQRTEFTRANGMRALKAFLRTGSTFGDVLSLASSSQVSATAFKPTGEARLAVFPNEQLDDDQSTPYCPLDRVLRSAAQVPAKALAA